MFEELGRRPFLRLLLLKPNRSLVSFDLRSSPAMFLTRTAASNSASRWMASNSSYLSSKLPGSSLASQILLTILRRFTRTTALLDCSFCKIRENRSGCARLSAMGGLKCRSFCKGSSKLSKALAFEVVKHLMIAWANDPSRRCSSTLAVSSWSLVYVCQQNRYNAIYVESYHTKIASKAVTCQYGSARREM